MYTVTEPPHTLPLTNSLIFVLPQGQQMITLVMSLIRTALQNQIAKLPKQARSADPAKGLLNLLLIKAL
jgi:hypothetical protein